MLAGEAEFESETLLAPDLAVHEVANALFVQQHVLHVIEDGLPYLERLYRAIEAESLVLVQSTRGLMRDAYEIANRNGGAVYDCVFVALALSKDLQLRTRDRKQARILEIERGKRADGSWGPQNSD